MNCEKISGAKIMRFAPFPISVIAWIFMHLGPTQNAEIVVHGGNPSGSPVVDRSQSRAPAH
jgi:hypothetical protein